MNIGIIGFGRFGELITRYLAQDHDVFVFSRSDKSDDITSLGATPASFEDVCSKEFVIPCVPISSFEAVVTQMQPAIGKGSIVVDICSVKEHAVEIMKKILPDQPYLATHPMFGPDSASGSLEGQKITLSNMSLSQEQYDCVKHYLEGKKLEVIETTPEKHDEEIAQSLFLTHFIGRSLIETHAQEVQIDTEGYRRILYVRDTAQNDTKQLFEDMYKYNAYAKKIVDRYTKIVGTIHQNLQ